MDRILLYHTGFEEIRSPDVHYGRKNADFGQGFYMSPDRSFSERWAKERKGSSTVINTYELLTDGLRIKMDSGSSGLTEMRSGLTAFSAIETGNRISFPAMM